MITKMVLLAFTQVSQDTLRPPFLPPVLLAVLFLHFFTAQMKLSFTLTPTLLLLSQVFFSFFQ